MIISLDFWCRLRTFEANSLFGAKPSIGRKCTWMLAEMKHRKSHPLEGSGQEAIPLPYPTFDGFSLGSSRYTPLPIGHLRRIRVFIPVASAARRRTSHPSGSRPRDVSLLGQTSAPGIVDAPENPRFPTVSNRVQRTVSMAPSRVQLFQGSRQRRRKLGHAAADHLSWVETGTNQNGWILSNFSPSFQPQPNGEPDLSQRLSSPQRAQGRASCNSRFVPAYGPRLSAPRPCCCGSWPACVGKSAGLLAESAGQTAPPPYTPTLNMGCHF